jgi:hypothetical protein
MLTLDDFDFDLPSELIAQYPTAERTASRLLQLGRWLAARPPLQRPAGTDRSRATCWCSTTRE